MIKLLNLILVIVIKSLPKNKKNLKMKNYLSFKK